MKKVRSTWVTVLVGAGIVLTSALAKADSLTLTLSAPFQTTGNGTVVDFNATVTNNTAGDLYLNADSFNVEAPLTLDDSPFFNDYPLFLAPSGDPGSSYTGELFAVTVPASTPWGLYTGDFEIIGGGPTDYSDVIGSANFNIGVTPEPGSLLLLASGLAGLMAKMKLRKA